MLRLQDKLILEQIQQDFPLVSEPYKEMAKNCSLSEKEFLDSLKSLKEQNIIRNISAIFKADRLGYKSILVALKSDNPDEIAQKINKHSGVSHNYLREHSYNVWFTLTIPQNRSFDHEVKTILENEEALFRLFPSLHTFKIGVNFRFTTPEQKQLSSHKPQKNLISFNIPLIQELQKEFPTTSKPWHRVAQNLNISVEELFYKISEYKEAGAIKRVSAVLRHRRAGFTFNGMICLALPDQKVGASGKKVAEFSFVSHCYQRPTYPDWPYNLFVMIHAQTKEESQQKIELVANSIACQEYIILFSTKEYKKERVRYFMETHHS